MVCTKCGLPLLGTESFCPQCGTPIAAEPAPSAAAPKAPAETPEPDVTEEEPPIVEVADVPLVASFEPGPPAELLQAPAEPPPAIRPPKAPPRAEAHPTVRPRPPTRPAPEPPPAASAVHQAATQRARLMGPLGLGLMAGCLVFFIIGLAALGVWQGLRLRSQNQNEAAAQHYAQGVAHLEKGEYDLAAAELEWALRLRPDYPEAEQKLAEARTKAAQPSPTAATSQTQPATLLAEGQAAYDRGAWDEAIQKLEALQTLDPNYEQALARRLLVGAYTNGGLKLVNEDRLEEAIRYFDQALTLQPDNSDVQQQRKLATLYQAALGTWGVNWRETIKDLTDLYALKPDYKDTSQRLLQAYIQAGNAAGAQSAWCDALEYYKGALALSSSPDLAAKRDDAAQRCASPTAVPGTPVPSGTYVGSFGGCEDIHFRTNDWAKVYGRVLNAKGEAVPGLKVKLSAFDWSGYARTDNNGYYSFEFLNQEVTFTVSLEGLPVQPVDVRTKFGYACLANFNEKQ